MGDEGGGQAITIRSARPNEADRLSELCLRSKAHWGYDAAFLDRCRTSLRIASEAIGDGRVFVAERNGAVVGVYRLDVDARTAELGVLFVEPRAIGTGVGRRLFLHAIDEARRLGCEEMTVQADPNAAPFYEAMGAVRAGMAPSDAVADRMLPRYRLPLTEAAARALP